MSGAHHGMTASVAALGGLATTLAIYAWSLARLRHFERSHAQEVPWWFGYACDGTNLAAALALWVLFVGVGFAAPRALALSVGLGLLTFALDALAGRVLRLRVASLAVIVTAVGVAAAVVARSAAIDAMLARLMTLVEPR